MNALSCYNNVQKVKLGIKTLLLPAESHGGN